MLMSILPIGVLAEEASAGNKTVVKQENLSVKSAQDVNVSGVKPIAIAEEIQILEYQGFQYQEKPEGLTLISYSGVLNEAKILEIPEKINGISVTKIDKELFKNNAELKEVIIPKGVTEIDKTAFDGCTGLEKITVDKENATYYDENGKLYQSDTKQLIIAPANWKESKTDEPVIQTEPATIQKNQSADKVVELPQLNPSAISNTDETVQTDAVLQEYEYVDIAGGIRILRYVGESTTVVIPTTINGKKVLEIEANAFAGQTQITKNILNSGLKTIGSETPVFRVDIFTTDKATTQYVNNGIKITAVGADGKTPYQYKFYYKLGTATVTIKNFATANTATFKPTKAGVYTLFVDVKDGNGNIATKSIENYSIVTNPSVKTFTTDKKSGQTTNTSIQLNAVGADGITPYQYKFYYKLGSTTTILQNYSITATATFKPIAAGTYTLYVDIKDAGGKTATKSITSYKVVNSLGVKSFITDKTSGQGVDTSIKLTATGSDGKTPYQYQFSYKLGSATTMIKDFSTTNTATFKPTVIGIYTLFVTIRDATGKTVTKKIDSYSIVPNPGVKTFTTDKVSGQGINTSIQLKAEGADGTTPYQYKFYYKLGTTTVTIKNFATANTATFKPTKAGTYTLWVDIKDATGKIGSASIADYTVIGDPSVKTFTTNKASGQTTNTDINLTATGADGKTPYQYKFSYKLGTKTSIIQDFGALNTAIFRPTAAGTYTLIVEVKDANGKVTTKSITSYKVINSLGVKSFITDKASGQGVNTSIKLSAVGSDGKTPYQYQFGYTKGSETTIIQNYSKTTTAPFKPSTVGAYTLFVTIKDVNGNTATKNIDSYSIVPDPSVSSFTTDKVSGQGINTSIQLKAEGADGKTPYQYKFYYKLGTKIVTLKNFATANTATFKPTKVGDYTLCVDIKDANGKISTGSIENFQVAEKPIVVVHPTSVSLNKTTDTLMIGDNDTLTETVLPANTSNKIVLWTSSDAKIAAVDTAGKVTGVSAGSATITVTTADGSKAATCVITVTDPIVNVTGITLSETTKAVTTGTNFNLTGTISPANATNKAVIWSSSNAAIATVDVTGKVTVHKAGTVTITVTTVDGSKAAACVVTVTDPIVNVTGITLSETTKAMITGTSFSLTGTISPANATNKAISWSSNNAAIAAVDGNGKVTAVSAGTATITITTVDGSKAATCVVTVTNPIVNVTGITLSETTKAVTTGTSFNLTSTISPANATNKAVSWSSSNAAIATVDGSGKVTAVSAGTATITVTTADGSKAATCVVTVTDPIVNVTGITLSETTKAVTTGTNFNLTGTISPANATNKAVIWSSSNAAIATVDGSGKVTAVSAGTATITVTTADGSKAATCVITVTDPIVNVTGITLSETTKAVTTGTNFNLTGTT